MYAREESYGASSGPKPCWGIKLSSNSSFTGLKSLSPSPESCPSTTNFFFSLYGSYWLRSRCRRFPFHWRAARFCWRKIRFQRIGKFFGWSLFSRPVKAHMYVFRVILFSVKKCREHATIHLLHFSITWDGFGNGWRLSSRIPRLL